MTHEEELNKAIKKYVDARLDKTYEAYGEHRQKQLSKFDAYDIEEAIEYGAEWMKEQMMKEAVEGNIYGVDEQWVESEVVEHIGQEGDKVKLIIIKED